MAPLLRTDMPLDGLRLDRRAQACCGCEVARRKGSGGGNWRCRVEECHLERIERGGVLRRRTASTTAALSGDEHDETVKR